MVLDRSFAITIRTRVGMNEEFKKQFDKWIRLQDYQVYVYEKEGVEEHLHAQIWLDQPRTKGNVAKPLKKMIQRCYREDEYILKNALLIKNPWNDKYREYCEKDEPLILENVPDDTSEYYPTEEEQKKFMEIAEGKKHWTIWRELESLWNKDEISELSVAQFLGEMMFIEKKIKIVEDNRKRQQMCKSFYLYMKGDRLEAGLAFLPKEQHDLFKMFLNNQDEG